MKRILNSLVSSQSQLTVLRNQLKLLLSSCQIKPFLVQIILKSIDRHSELTGIFLELRSFIKLQIRRQQQMIFIFEFGSDSSDLQLIQHAKDLINPVAGQLLSRVVQTLQHPTVGRRRPTKFQYIALFLKHRDRLPERRSLFFNRVIVDLDFGQLVLLKPQKIRIDPIRELSRQINIKFNFVSLVLVRATDVIVFFIATLSERLFSAGESHIAGFVSNNVVNDNLSAGVLKRDPFPSCFRVFDRLIKRIDNPKTLMLFNQSAGQ